MPEEKSYMDMLERTWYHLPELRGHVEACTNALWAWGYATRTADLKKADQARLVFDAAFNLLDNVLLPYREEALKHALEAWRAERERYPARLQAHMDDVYQRMQEELERDQQRLAQE